MVKICVEKRTLLSKLIILSLILSMMFLPLSAMASGGGEITTEEAMEFLTDYVYDALKDKSYKLDGGGTLKGSSLMEDMPESNVKTINEANFSKLTSKAQSEFVQDVADASNETIGSSGVEQSTVQEWWRMLQSKEGVGSKFMFEVLRNTKPDFVTANEIYSPFSGVVNTVMAVGCIIIVSLLGVVMVCDIAYITLPPFRVFVTQRNNTPRGDKTKVSITSYIVTHNAINAVQQAETAGSNGENKQALGMYFKSQAIALIILGICLMYLVQGQLYTLVGWILDLLRGFLKF